MPNINLLSQSAGSNFTVPAGWIIRDLYVYNNTSNAITGGLKFGTTAGGTDVITALAVGATGRIRALDSEISKAFFSTSANQIIYFDAVTAWNSANVNLHVKLERLNT